MNLLNKFKEAFKDRKMPATLTSSDQLSDQEIKDALAFSGKNWADVNCDLIEKHSDAVFWLSPKAFCYYLPGICCAGIKENRSDLLIYDSLIGMLDRSPVPQYWDSFFLERWPLLSAQECEVLQEWLLWIVEMSDKTIDEHSISRSMDTLELLRSGITAFR